MKRKIANHLEKSTKNMINRFVLKEQLTIQQAETLKKELLVALNKSEYIHIVGEKITDMDITFVQLMFALKKSSLKINKKINFQIQPTAELSYLLEHNGFNQLNEDLNK